jgi:hypothetical protein
MRGEEIYGTLNSADASTAAALTLYTQGGIAIASRALGTTERLVITDVMMSIQGTAFDAALIWDTDGSGVVKAGDMIARLKSADGQLAIAFNVPRYGPTGKTPKVKAGAAGTVDVIIHGFIQKV